MAAARHVLDGSGDPERGDLAGVRVLVTAGGTREPIDPVRVITNRSSGKQGYAVAEVAARRGATVTLVTTIGRPASPSVEIVNVQTAAEMEEAVMSRAAEADVIVHGRRGRRLPAQGAA